MTELKISEDGVVLEPGFHDGYITGLAFEDDRIEIGLKTVDQRMYKLTLNHPTEFQVSGEGLGNIVYNLNVLTGRRPPPSLDLPALLSIDHLEPIPALREKRQAEWQERIDSIASGKLVLCWNTASLGLSFVALCRSVELSIAGVATTRQPYESRY